jgi:hypothetical protein
MEIANTIDEKLFADYTRRRAKVIKEIVKRGILGGIDWSTLKQPFGKETPKLNATKTDICSRRPTLCPPSPSLTSINPCPSHLNLPRHSSPRNNRPSRVLLLRPTLFIPQSPILLHGRNASSDPRSRISPSNSWIERFEAGGEYFTSCLWNY